MIYRFSDTGPDKMLFRFLYITLADFSLWRAYVVDDSTTSMGTTYNTNVTVHRDILSSKNDLRLS